jgi:hypothetical protein
LVPPLQHIIDTYHCCFGPSDNSQNVARAASLAAAGRRKGTERQADPGAARQKALAAIADTEQVQSSLIDLLQVDDPRWARLALETNTYKLRLMTLQATLVMEGPSVQRCGALPVNPDAPDNFSTKRLLRAEERGRNRSKAPHKPPLSAESPEKNPVPQEGRVEERGVEELGVRETVVEGRGLREGGVEERAVAFPVARRAPQQAILVAAITEQTVGQHTKAIQARDQAARKRKNTSAKVAAFSPVAPRQPLTSLAPEEVEQCPGGAPDTGFGEAHWLLQNMVLSAALPAVAQLEPALVKVSLGLD